MVMQDNSFRKESDMRKTVESRRLKVESQRSKDGSERLKVEDGRCRRKAINAVIVAFIACVSLGHLVGCESADKTVAVLGVLQQGQARGHLVVTTSAALSAGLTNEFFFGAKDTSLTFDGNIDFGDANFDPLLDRVEEAAKEVTAEGG